MRVKRKLLDKKKNTSKNMLVWERRRTGIPKTTKYLESIGFRYHGVRAEKSWFDLLN